MLVLLHRWPQTSLYGAPVPQELAADHTWLFLSGGTDR